MKNIAIMVLFPMVACVAFAAYAHDADTVAFYSFANLENGSSVTNGIVNEIDSSKFPGTFEVGGAGDVVVSDDSPGDYIFSTLGHLSANDAVCVKPKSIYFDGTGADACKLLFDGMATYLSSNDAYTVEFFYKLADDAVAGETTDPFIVWRGNWQYGKTTTEPADEVRFFFRNVTGNANALFLAGYNGDTRLPTGTAAYPAGTCLGDGKWHHVALAWPVGGDNMQSVNMLPERRNAGERIPYMKKNGVLEESYPFTFNSSGNFKGWISCIRVSKKLRTDNDTLCASKLPTCIPQTVAYYRLEGEPGASVAAPVSNSAPTYAECNPQLFVWPVQDTYTRSTGWLTGEGSLMNAIDGATTKYSSDVKRNQVIADGEEASNTSSIRIEPAEAEAGGDWQLAQGLFVSNTVFATLLREHTFEMFFKFDKNLWMERIGSKALSPATSNLATLAWMSYGANGQVNSWNLSIDMTQPESPALIWRSDSTPASGNRCLAPTVTDGNWHHIAAMRRIYSVNASGVPSYRMYLYLDGNLFIERNYSYAQTDGQAANRQFYIGSPYRAAVNGKAGYQSHAFAGELDEIRITARALDPSEFLRQRSVGMRIIFR